MSFPIKETKKKSDSTYKTIYLSRQLIERIEQLAIKNETSFNNIVVSMIEHCLDE